MILLNLNARKTNLIVVGDENANVYIGVDGETIAKVNSFKYIGAINSNTGSWSEDTKASVGRAKKATWNWIQFGNIEEFEKNSIWNWWKRSYDQSLHTEQNDGKMMKED